MYDFRSLEFDAITKLIVGADEQGCGDVAIWTIQIIGDTQFLFPPLQVSSISKVRVESTTFHRLDIPLPFLCHQRDGIDVLLDGPLVAGRLDPLVECQTHLCQFFSMGWISRQALQFVRVSGKVVEFFFRPSRRHEWRVPFAFGAQDFHKRFDWISQFLVAAQLQVRNLWMEVPDVFESLRSYAADTIRGVAATIASSEQHLVPLPVVGK